MAAVNWTLTFSHRQHGGSIGGFDTFRSDAVETKFFDGIAGMGLGAAVTRLELFNTNGAEVNNGVAIERREVDTTLVIPTPALVELAVNVLTAVRANQDLLSQPAENLRSLIAGLAKDFSQVAPND